MEDCYEGWQYFGKGNHQTDAAYGVSTVYACACGGKRRRHAGEAGPKRHVCLVLCISCIVAALFWIGTFVFPRNIMRFLTNESELIVLGSEYLKIIGISYFLSAIAQVCMTIMKNWDAGKVLTKVSVLCGALSGILLLALSPAIIRFAGLTPQAREYLKGMFAICAYYLAGKSVNSMTIGGIFPAGGDSRFGLLCDAVTLWCITIPIGCLCAFVWMLPVLTVYFALNLDEIVKLPVVYRHYKKFKWLKNLTNGGTQNE